MDFISPADLDLINNLRQATRSSNLLNETLINKRIPSRQRIAESAGRMAKDLLSNPIATVKQGLQRDYAANQLAARLGSGRSKITKSVISSFKEPIKDLAVNIGGFAGSMALGSMGLPAQLAGDFGGAFITRRAIDDIQTTREVFKELKGMDSWRKQSLLSKTTSLVNTTGQRIIDKYNQTPMPLLDDTVGWAVGNSVAESLPLPVPLKGAGVALAYAPTLTDGVRELMSGTPLNQVASNTKRALGERTEQLFKQGSTRELAARQKFNSQLEQALSPMNLTRRLAKM